MSPCRTVGGARASIYPVSLAALALSATICAVGYWLKSRLGWAGSGILILTGIAVALTIVFPRRMARLEGSNEVGMLLMQVFFAAIGASANIAAVL